MQRLRFPLRWLLIVAVSCGAPIGLAARYKKALRFLWSAFFVLQLAVPALSAVYVRPNEISIERPYIERHIQATTAAFGLDRNATERPFTASAQADGGCVQDATLLDNIRLWDLRAYNATITQIQALRPYYTFPDTDVDRYFINGRSSRCCCPPARWTSASYPPRLARAGSIRVSFIRTALAWWFRK